MAMAVVMLVGRHTSEARGPFPAPITPKSEAPDSSRVLGSTSTRNEVTYL